MKRTAHSTFKTFLSLLLAILMGLAVPSAGPMQASQPQDQEVQGDIHRADPCEQVPDPSGKAIGIEKMCQVKGSSSGIAKGDFNGDGIADLAIGIPGKTLFFGSGLLSATDVAAGAVQIIYGSSANGLTTTGVLPPQLLTELSPLSLVPLVLTNERAASGDNFGASLAAGDFDGDGFTDLAVGIPGKHDALGLTTAVGAVMVFKGSASGLSSTPITFLGPGSFSQAANPVNSHGATSLTWGNFNGDVTSAGIPIGDLAVASDETINSLQVSRVTVLFGSAPAGLGAGGEKTFTLDHLNHTTAPLILSAGDFDHDGFSDLVAGSPLADPPGATPGTSVPSAGIVHVLPGSTTGPTTTRQQNFFGPFANLAGTTPINNDQLGAAVAVGDFNHDLFDDLAIGVPNGNSGLGKVLVIRGSANGLQNSGSQSLSPFFTFTNTFSFCSTANCLVQNFGAALAANDFDGDGFKDLAVGAPTAITPGSPARTTGAVKIFFGSSSGLGTTSAILRSATEEITPPLGCGLGCSVDLTGAPNFGASLTAWNFGHSSQADLAIGAPRAVISGTPGAGFVSVFYGSPSGLSSANLQFWNENSVGLNTFARANDHFGQGVY